MKTRVKVAESLNGFSRRIWTIGAVSLMIVVSLSLASCGGDEEASGAVADEDVAAFARFDADESGDLDENELNEGLYEDFDADDSETIGEGEFDTGADTWYDDYDGDFSGLDADDNDVLDQDEFDESVADSGVYDEYDANDDDVIDEDEFVEQT